MHVICKAVLNDAYEIHCLIRAVTQDLRSKGIAQWDDVYPTLANIESDIIHHSLYKYEEDGRIIGVLTMDELVPAQYCEVPWLTRDDRVGLARDDREGLALSLHRMAVLPECEGRGIAHALMSFAESYAIEHSYASIRFDAYAKNTRAVSLYHKLGFTEVGELEFRTGLFKCFEKLI